MSDDADEWEVESEEVEYVVLEIPAYGGGLLLDGGDGTAQQQQQQPKQEEQQQHGEKRAPTSYPSCHILGLERERPIVEIGGEWSGGGEGEGASAGVVYQGKYQPLDGSGVASNVLLELVRKQQHVHETADTQEDGGKHKANQKEREKEQTAADVVHYTSDVKTLLLERAWINAKDATESREEENDGKMEEG